MKVGAADAGQEDADLDVIDADFRLGNIFEPKARAALTFYESFHFCLPYAVAKCESWVLLKQTNTELNTLLRETTAHNSRTTWSRRGSGKG